MDKPIYRDGSSSGSWTGTVLINKIRSTSSNRRKYLCHDSRRAVKKQELQISPSTLHNALKAPTEDEVVKAALGSHIYAKFVERNASNGQIMPISGS